VSFKGSLRFSRWSVFIGVLFLFGCNSELLHRIPEDQAAEIVTILQQHGIAADTVIDEADENTWTIVVPRDSSNRARSILNEYRLPRAEERRFRDIFGQRKLVMTPMEEKALYLEGQQGEIAHMLKRSDRVVDATVALVPMERDIRGIPTGEAKASVLLRYQPNEQALPPLSESEVKRLVANGVEHLDPDRVTVVMQPTSIPAPTQTGENDYTLVRLGPLVVVESALPALKWMVGVAVLLLGGLGVAVFWQSRLIGALRDELASARTGLPVPGGDRSSEMTSV